MRRLPIIALLTCAGCAEAHDRQAQERRSYGEALRAQVQACTDRGGVPITQYDSYGRTWALKDCKLPCEAQPAAGIEK